MKQIPKKLLPLVEQEKGKPSPVGIALLCRNHCESLQTVSDSFGNVAQIMAECAVYAESLKELKGLPALWLTDFYDEYRERFLRAQKLLEKAVSILNVEDLEEFISDIDRKSAQESSSWDDIEQIMNFIDEDE